MHIWKDGKVNFTGDWGLYNVRFTDLIFKLSAR